MARRRGARSGGELFYASGDKMMAVDVDSGTTFRRARATMQNAGPVYLSSLLCLAPDPICLHWSRSRPRVSLPGLTFSIILPASYGAAPLAVYPRRSVIA